jgi:hypothetical protein
MGGVWAEAIRDSGIDLHCLNEVYFGRSPILTLSRTHTCATIFMGKMVWGNEKPLHERLDSTEVKMIHMITDHKHRYFRDQ